MWKSHTVWILVAKHEAQTAVKDFFFKDFSDSLKQIVDTWQGWMWQDIHGHFSGT